MKKFGKNKIALFLACTSVLGNKASAMDMGKAQSPQTVAAVGGAVSRNNNTVQQGLSKKQKFTIATIASILAVTAVGLTIWGVKKHLSSKDDPGKNDNKDDNKKNNENIEVSNEDNAENLNENSPKKGEKINNNSTLNKKNNAKTQDQEFKFREQNMKMIRENGELGTGDINKLIDIIDHKVDYNIGHISTYKTDEKKFDEDGLPKEVEIMLYDKNKDGLIKDTIQWNDDGRVIVLSLADWNSWIETLFDVIRGKTKICKVEECGSHSFRVFMDDKEICFYDLTIAKDSFTVRKVGGLVGFDEISVKYVFEKGNI